MVAAIPEGWRAMMVTKQHMYYSIELQRFVPGFTRRKWWGGTIEVDPYWKTLYTKPYGARKPTEKEQDDVVKEFLEFIALVEKSEAKRG